MMLVDLFTAAAFAGVIVCGLMLIVMQDLRAQRPDARIKARMQSMFGHGKSKDKDKKKSGVEEETLFIVDDSRGIGGRWLEPKLARLNTVAADSGVRIVLISGLVMEVVALLMTHFMPLPTWTKPLIVLGLPLVGIVRSYAFLEERFRKRFLDGFPDLIDMIVRAVRAGVPVTQVITTATTECEEPLKGEFKLMSDSLQVGRELDEVLEVAMKRIQIADFSFFCVCLLLQRETGGQLGETLENLSNIVRTRREVRQKTKALTAEARITTKILGAIPVVIMAGMYLLNKDSLMLLFDRELGHKMLTFAVISIVLGIIVINKMSKLDTSR